jgi:cytochrome c heme-lyase
VKHSEDSDSSLNKPPSFWGSLFLSPSASAPVNSSESGTPVQGKDASPPVNGLSELPASLEEAASHAQTAQADQLIPLGTERQVSTIPRGDGETTPSHQHEESANNWVYPSEQQLYNAMRKKGWSNIPEESISTVLQIHNNINERTWRQIQSWEGTESLNLARFQGRPRDMTPKAFMLSYIFRLYDPPFDRHDWYVVHNGLQQRYVIDYYYLPPTHPDMPPTPYVDARPALDHPRAVWLHSRRFLQHAFPGIAAYLNQRRDSDGR